jgi:hypothetical protein
VTDEALDRGAFLGVRSGYAALIDHVIGTAECIPRYS